MGLWKKIADHIARAVGQRADPVNTSRPVGTGGTQATILETTAGKYFVKLNRAEHEPMFAAEAEGLRTIQDTRVIRVPSVVCFGSEAGTSFLALEYLDLIRAGREAQEELGRRLAALHRVTHPRFGWHRDNTIGVTPQLNAYASDWVEFFRDRRLRFQLALCASNGYRELEERAEPLLDRLGAFFSGYRCSASLLHGDLWNGNAGATTEGEPVIFDPALYFGDREADLAMTKLFGGFSDAFYSAYEAEWPLAPGYETRCTLYNWYHVLNHVNLFGASYLGQARQMLAQLLAEIA